MSEKHGAAPPVEPDADHDGKKARIAASWGHAAEAYVEKFLQPLDDDDTHMDMSAGRKMVVSRVVSAMSDKESPVVLDVASAGGEPALAMAKEMPHATVHGTDFAPEMVEQVRKRGAEAGASNLHAGVEDGEALSGFDDGSVDALTCTWGLESMMDHAQAIRQFHRVLKPDGVAVLAVWQKDPNSITVKMFRVISALQGDAVKTEFSFSHMQALGGDDGVDAMKDAGFEDVTVTPHSVPFYVAPTFGYRELFSCMVKCTPMDAVLSFMEEHGRPNVRDEASALFETQIMEDIEQGHAPTGPGLPSGKHQTAAGDADGDDSAAAVVAGSSKASAQPAFHVQALLLQGRKGA